MRGGHQTTSNNQLWRRYRINWSASLNVKTTEQYKSATLNTGQLMSTKNRTRRTTTRNIRFPNQMIEQINIALEQKRSKFLSLSRASPPSETTSKRHIHQLKVIAKKNRHPAFNHSRQDDIVNSLNYEDIAVIELRFYHFSDNWQTTCWLCHRLNGWMISSYGDQSTAEIILHIIIVLHQRCLNALNASRSTLCFIYMQLQHQNNS